MKNKKIFMIVLLVAFVIGLVITVVSISSYSEEKIIETSKKEEGKEIRGIDNSKDNSNNIVNITDSYFIEQTNDIYYNLGDYLGKAIKIEGFVSFYEDDKGNTKYCVVRNTPGCCGNDGLAGLDIRYNGEYPSKNTWVEIIGVIEKDNVYEKDIPAIQVNSIKETKEGVTFVTN